MIENIHTNLYQILERSGHNLSGLEEPLVWKTAVGNLSYDIAIRSYE